MLALYLWMTQKLMASKSSRANNTSQWRKLKFSWSISKHTFSICFTVLQPFWINRDLCQTWTWFKCD
jgi:hypothetical protein